MRFLSSTWLPPHPGFAWRTYIALEAASEQKHEFLDGEIFAISGGTLEHARLAIRVAVALTSALAGRPCAVLSSDARVRVAATGFTSYPDVTVVCGKMEVDPADANTLTNPVVIVEVLSDSTGHYDRHDKRAQLRRISSLREYVLVAQHEKRVEHYGRNDNGTWTFVDLGEGDMLDLGSLGLRVAVDAIYENPLG